MDSSMLLSSLCNLAFCLLLSSSTLFLSWVMSLSITVHYTWEFMRLATSGKIDKKLADNKFGSTGSWYSPTTFQSRKVMPYSSSVPHDHMYAYKASMFYRLIASPPLIGNIVFSFILLYLFWPAVSTLMTSYVILDDGLTVPQCWTGIWRW